MPEQNLANHAHRPTLFLIAGLVTFVTLVAAVVGLFRISGESAMHFSLLIAAICLAMLFGFVSLRQSALKAQDRAIRAEENLRHFVLTGKLLDSRLAIQQIIAVRFASDDQFVELARQAADQSMKPADIKKAVKNWRGDFHRA